MKKSHKNTDENINWKKNSNIAWSWSLQWSDNHRFINQWKGNKKHFIINYAHYSECLPRMTLFSDLCGNYLRLELHLRQVIYRLTEASQWKKRCMKALITCLISFKLKNPLIYFFFDNILEKHFKSISSTLQLKKILCMEYYKNSRKKKPNKLDHH